VTLPFLPFNRPYTTGQEFEYIRQAIECAHLSGDGMFTKRCQQWLEQHIGCVKALLTHSCTAALEMSALLTWVRRGDEELMPSFTFVSTANAFVLRGAVPVFVDIRPDTLNLDERQLEDAITKHTRVIVPVHYAGVVCEMDVINALAQEHGLIVVEDAAQALGSRYQGRRAGSFGALAATSFHETKNLTSGEGGALFVNGETFVERAETIREKGTNRSKFHRGEIEKYSWLDLGSSYVPSELTAAFLWAQIEAADHIVEKRLEIWDWYYEAFGDLERRERLRRPIVPKNCSHNAHMFYILLRDGDARGHLLERLKEAGINAVFHYVPLHSSEAGLRFGRSHGSLPFTDSISGRIVRLPLWIGMTRGDVDRVAGTVACILH
jgi:dTDP-4-amino-4,6-dideoxygalactose transaminase